MHCFKKKTPCFVYAKSSRQAQHKRSSLVQYPTQLPWQSVKARLLITGNDRIRFKENVTKFTPLRPKCKNDDGHCEKNTERIIDQLMYTAHQTIKNSIKVFNKRFPNQPQWDPDLGTSYKWARGRTGTEPEWKALSNDLDKDIITLKVE